MITMSRVALAAVFAIGLASAAQAQSAQIPTPVNPYPAFPVATDGTPLPHAQYDGTVYGGRSVGFGPVDGLVGGAVDTGLGVAGTAVNNGVNAVGQVVR